MLRLASHRLCGLSSRSQSLAAAALLRNPVSAGADESQQLRSVTHFSSSSIIPRQFYLPSRDLLPSLQEVSAMLWSHECLYGIQNMYFLHKSFCPVKELCCIKEEAASAEERFQKEVATLIKLVDLYKESVEEWSRKAGELEAVIKALEIHSSQVESDYKEKLD